MYIIYGRNFYSYDTSENGIPVLQCHLFFFPVPERGDMGKAQRFQHSCCLSHPIPHILGAVAVRADGDAGAAQLMIMPQNIKMGQTHG